MTPPQIDYGMVLLANVFNLLVVGVFLARAHRLRRLEWMLGLGVVLLALPASVAIIANMLEGREWWTIVLPLFFLSYCILEFVLDYVLKSDSGRQISCMPILPSSILRLSPSSDTASVYRNSTVS